MSDTPRHEPKYHKHTTFQYLLEARREVRRAQDARDVAERAVQEAHAKVISFEKDAVEWMRRDNTPICTMLQNGTYRSNEVSHVIVFRLVESGDAAHVHHHVTEPER